MTNLKIQLLQRLIYYWDVFFTFIDHKQLKLWMSMKAKLSNLKSNKCRIGVNRCNKCKRSTHIDPEVDLAWKDATIKSIEMKQNKIRRTSGL